MIASDQSETNEQLVARFQAGDRSALDTLVQQNEGLVQRIARKQRSSHFDFDDLLQEGRIGVWRAAELFNSDFGTKFTTYACPWIYAKISIWKKFNRTIQVPVNQQARGVFVNVISSDAKMGRTERSMMSSLASLSLRPDQIIADNDERSHLISKMMSRLERLSLRDQAIVMSHYLESKTLVEIGIELGVSHQRVHQLFSRAIDILQLEKYELSKKQLRSISLRNAEWERDLIAADRLQLQLRTMVA